MPRPPDPPREPPPTPCANLTARRFVQPTIRPHTRDPAAAAPLRDSAPASTAASRAAASAALARAPSGAGCRWTTCADSGPSRASQRSQWPHRAGSSTCAQRQRNSRDGRRASHSSSRPRPLGAPRAFPPPCSGPAPPASLARSLTARSSGLHLTRHALIVAALAHIAGPAVELLTLGQPLGDTERLVRNWIARNKVAGHVVIALRRAVIVAPA